MVVARFRIGAWMADVACFVVCQPVWPACWLDTPDRSSSSAARVVQDVWDVFREELGVVPAEVVLTLRDAVSRSSVDDFWSTWSRHAEAGLFRAYYSRAGGPTEAGSAAFLGRGLLRIRSRRLGGRAVGGRGSGRLCRASRGDEADVHCAQYFGNSSIIPVVLFRRRLRSVADVLKGIRNKGFTRSRWDAFLGHWEAVCRHGPCGPISSLDPWDRWIPPDLHGFHRLVFDSFELLNGFLKQVVVSRRDLGFASGPIGFGGIWVQGLMPGFCWTSFLPSPFLVIGTLSLSRLRFWWSPISLSPQGLDAFFLEVWSSCGHSWSVPGICRSSVSSRTPAGFS